MCVVADLRVAGPARGRLTGVNPIVTQVLTIAGVLLGSTATFIATSATERTRWRRAHSARWDDKRLLAYAEYANAVKRAVRLCRRIAETKNLLSTGRPIEDIEAALTELADAETERAVKWETVLLLGEPETISAARAWHEKVWQLEAILRKEDQGDTFVDTYKEAMLLRNAFYVRARADLNVTSGTLPEPTWGSLRL